MTRALFVAGKRTPFGRSAKGAYHDLRADELLVELFAQQVNHSKGFAEYGIDDCIVGCAYPEGEQGYNVARIAALGAGLDVAGVTVNRLCASSLEAAAIAAAKVRCGWGRLFLVGGLESMSRVPRRGANFSESDRVRQASPHAYMPMGDTAEKVARQFAHISRTRQEDFAESSHERASRAYERGDYTEQIFPFRIARDEFIRYPVDRTKMASLLPAFTADGVVTAATSSPLTDGATSGWVLDFDTALNLGVTQGLEIVDYAIAHVSPDVMGMGPVPAMQSLFRRHQLSPSDIAAFEINEAFAIQVLACAEELSLPLERVNAWGGALAIGHPLGASGLRLLMTLHDRLRRSDHPTGLGIASLCVGGGQGAAMLARWVSLP